MFVEKIEKLIDELIDCRDEVNLLNKDERISDEHTTLILSCISERIEKMDETIMFLKSI